MEPEIFDVIFLDDDRKKVLDKQLVKAGEKAEYKGEIPVKEPTAQESYLFCGWTDEEKLESVTENLVVVAKYTVEVKKSVKEAMYNSTFDVAKETGINDAVNSGKRLDSQQKALEKDPRTPSEIVSDIMKNGKTELGQEVNKDNIDR